MRTDRATFTQVLGMLALLMACAMIPACGGARLDPLSPSEAERIAYRAAAEYGSWTRSSMQARHVGGSWYFVYLAADPQDHRLADVTVDDHTGAAILKIR